MLAVLCQYASSVVDGKDEARLTVDIERLVARHGDGSDAVLSLLGEYFCKPVGVVRCGSSSSGVEDEERNAGRKVK